MRLARIEKLKERKNRLSGEIGKVKKSGGDATVLMREVEEVSETIRKGEEPLAEIEARFENFMLTVPNLPEASVPVGRSAAENREVRRWGIRHSSISRRKITGTSGKSSGFSISHAQPR